MLRSVAGSIFFASQCAAALSSTADMLVRNCTKMGTEVLYMEIVMECGSFAGGRSGNLASIGGIVCPCRKSNPVGNRLRIRTILRWMCDLCRLIFGLVVGLFRSRAALEAEVLVLKQQIIVLRRGKPNRMSFLAVDRFILGWVCRPFPKAHDALAIVRPDTVVRWHRAGFRLFWRWKSRRGLGRPAVPIEIRQLIREMSIANPLWGAPRIHGELLRLGIDVGQTSVAKYMVRRRGPPSQGWKTFLRRSVKVRPGNDGTGSSAMQLFIYTIDRR